MWGVLDLFGIVARSLFPRVTTLWGTLKRFFTFFGLRNETTNQGYTPWSFCDTIVTGCKLNNSALSWLYDWSRLRRSRKRQKSSQVYPIVISFLVVVIPPHQARSYPLVFHKCDYPEIFCACRHNRPIINRWNIWCPWIHIPTPPFMLSGTSRNI